MEPPSLETGTKFVYCIYGYCQRQIYGRMFESFEILVVECNVYGTKKIV